MNDKLVLDRNEAYSNLDRIINFNNSCDNKVAIILAMYGVLLTIMATNSMIKICKMIVKASATDINNVDRFFILLAGLAIFCFVFGIFYLCLVLFAKIDCIDYADDELELDSCIYFRDISKNGNYKLYKDKVLKKDNEVLINDILSQIFINSKICTKKYERYRRGFIMSIIGFSSFLLLYIIGYISYL